MEEYYNFNDQIINKINKRIDNNQMAKIYQKQSSSWKRYFKQCLSQKNDDSIIAYVFFTYIEISIKLQIINIFQIKKYGDEIVLLEGITFRNIKHDIMKAFDIVKKYYKNIDDIESLISKIEVIGRSIGLESIGRYVDLRYNYTMSDSIIIKNKITEDTLNMMKGIVDSGII